MGRVGRADMVGRLVMVDTAEIVGIVLETYTHETIIHHHFASLKFLL